MKSTHQTVEVKFRELDNGEIFIKNGNSYQKKNASKAVICTLFGRKTTFFQRNTKVKKVRRCTH